MADDKTGGDDLFEDLDKFFAPIKDVDWESDEPAAAGAEPPREEHVEVHRGEPLPAVAAPDPASPGPPATGPPAAEPPAGPPEYESTEDDESWYDTSVLEPIGDLLGEPMHVDEDEAEHGPLTPADSSEEPSDQAGLFDEPETDEAEAADASFPIFPDDGDAEIDEPSEAELDAAAEHFAESVRLDDEQDAGAFGEAVGDETEVVVVETQDGGDLRAGQGDAGDVEDDILSDLEETEDTTPAVVVGPEGLGGPSWQEPASVEVGADIDRRGPHTGDRDVSAAFLTAIVLIVLSLGSLLIGRQVFAVIAALVALLAQGELFGSMVKRHHQPATLVGLVGGALMIAGAYFHGEPGLLAMFALSVTATFLWFMASPAPQRRHTLVGIALTILNLAYVPLLAGYLIITLTLGSNSSDGKALVVAVIGLTFIYDTAAFLVGSVWGGSFFQRPLAPNTSPKKSLEGLIGATLITVIVSMALVPSFVGPFEDKRIEALFLAIVVAAAATLGDLAESLIKRDLGIKDMSTLLPGHGGVLDRIDSLLFVAPAAFLLFRLIFA